jgi:hypothetical protein
MAWPTEAGALRRAQAAPTGKDRKQRVHSHVLRTGRKPLPTPGSQVPRGRTIGLNPRRKKKRSRRSAVQRFGKLKLSRYYVDLREHYRMFNAAAYRFYKSTTGPPLESDAPFASNPTLPHSPADLFSADGAVYFSVSWFNGVLDSGFLPIGPNGESYLRLDLTGGAAVNAPPQGPFDFKLLLRPAGVVRIVAAYAEQGALRATVWAITYTTNGATPGTPPAVSPTVTAAIAGGNLSLLEHDLPGQAHGTTVKVRLQVRRNDGTWVYSENSVVLTAIADATGPGAAEGAGIWRGAAPQEL